MLFAIIQAGHQLFARESSPADFGLQVMKGRKYKVTLRQILPTILKKPTQQKKSERKPKQPSKVSA